MLLFRSTGLSECVVLTIDAGMVDGVPILLAKPQTYMNLSGESVSNFWESSLVLLPQFFSIVAQFVAFTHFLKSGALIWLMHLKHYFNCYLLNFKYWHIACKHNHGSSVQ
jgi:hypothetical protein